MSTLRRAFTLIELLIVVAIVAILAAIAVPNFLEAQTRSKVSRVRADLRTTAVAMEAYHVDAGRYPIPSDEQGLLIEDVLGARFVSPFETRVPVLLTTPIAHLTSRTIDPFAATRVGESRYYHALTVDYLMIRQNNAPATNWLVPWFRLWRELTDSLPPESMQYYLMSLGPNQEHDAMLPHVGPGGGVPHTHNRGAIYDPTNGTMSNGDIYYLGPGIGFIN